VVEAAVIGVLHPTWEGTPLLVVVTVAGANVTKQSTRRMAHREGRIAKWWMPDDIVFIDALSYGATGKIQRMELRHRITGHYSPPLASAGDERRCKAFRPRRPRMVAVRDRAFQQATVLRCGNETRPCKPLGRFSGFLSFRRLFGRPCRSWARAGTGMGMNLLG
jgi:AMP-binding enzyme C-terminal domain